MVEGVDRTPVCVASTNLRNGSVTTPNPLSPSGSSSTPAFYQSETASDDTLIDEDSQLTWFKTAEW
jgi:hypothetical protein